MAGTTLRRRLVRRTVTALLVAATTVACTSGSDPVASALPAAFDDGVPPPADEVVLTLDGADWDLPTIERLEQHDLTILEPFIEEEHTYTGPLLADVLRASGVDLDATSSVELVALDDFVTDIPLEPAALDGLLLATRQDGVRMAIADGGPIRLIFPPGNELGENLNNWIWSIRTATSS